MSWFQKRYSSIKKRSPKGLFRIRKHKHASKDIVHEADREKRSVEQWIRYCVYRWDFNKFKNDEFNPLAKEVKEHKHKADEIDVDGKQSVLYYINKLRNDVFHPQGRLNKLAKDLDDLIKRVEALEKV